MDQQKEQLVLENLDVVRVLMWRTAATSWLESQDWEDAYQAGCVGLVQAARRYVPGKASFRTYAWRRVRGALLDWARGKHPMYKAYRVRRHGDTPPSVVSLEAIVPDNSSDSDDLTIVASLATTQDVEHEAVVRLAFSHLSERERLVVEGRMRGYYFREIGETLGCSQTNAVYVWKKALAKLREALA